MLVHSESLVPVVPAPVNNGGVGADDGHDAAAMYAPAANAVIRPQYVAVDAALSDARFVGRHLPLRLKSGDKRPCDLCFALRATVTCTCGHNLCLTTKRQCYAWFHDPDWVMNDTVSEARSRPTKRVKRGPQAVPDSESDEQDNDE